MAKRKLEELNLMDDFLFGTMLTYPGVGEEFVRILLSVIFQRKFGQLTVIPQKPYYGVDTDKHGARLDVYLEENTGTPEAVVYDIDPDQKNDTVSKEGLPKRTRFYHAKIDAGSLESGEDYRKLKKVIVVMITPFDPFGRNRMVYTIRNSCEEDADIPYDDEARTVFLYTKGKEGNPPKELRQLLRYFEDTKEQNVVNETLKRLDQMVQTVRRDREVTWKYMKVLEWEERCREEGREEERKNTERERKNAEHERQNAERERARAEEALKEIAYLKAELKKWEEQV